jgi:hypothetical protein
MATVLEGCTTKEKRSVVQFLWANRLNAKNVHAHKEMFPFYGGKSLSCKVVHNWVVNISPMTKKLKLRCESG